MTGTSGEQARPYSAEAVQVHPPEFVLADFVDGAGSAPERDAVAAHLAECRVCQSVVSEVGQPASAARETPDVGAVRLPGAMTAAMADRTVAAPASGQLWRLRAPAGGGEEVAAIVVVLQVADDVLVAPATFDSQESTDLWTLQAEVVGTDVSVAVWVSLEQFVGWETLDVLLGAVDPSALHAVHRALRKGLPPPADVPMGRPIDDELGEYRTRLSSRLTLISEARLGGSVWAGSEGEDAPQVDIHQAMRDAGWSIAQVREAAGISSRDARLVIDRQGTLSDEQAGRVAAALGLDDQVAPSVSSNPAWARAVASPVFRPRFDDVADRQHASAWELRHQTSRTLVPARGSNDSAQDYYALVDQHLERLEREVGLRG